MSRKNDTQQKKGWFVLLLSFIGLKALINKFNLKK